MPTPSSTVRSLPYPSLEDGNFSYPSGSYEVSAKVSERVDTKVTLHHQISDAPFIEGLIDKGEARFACLVAVPKTGYRKLCLSDDREQEVSWDMSVVGEPPILGPVVLYVGESKSHEFSEVDGVASIWQGKTIELPKGARLAKGSYLRPSISIDSLLKVRLKDDLPDGTFTVTDNANKGFYFTMDAAPDLFRFVGNSMGRPELRDSILTHAVSQCFSILKSDYSFSEDDEESEDHWKQHKNLAALSDWLNTKDLLHWSDEGFDAVSVATHLYPIRIPKQDSEEEDDQ